MADWKEGPLGYKSSYQIFSLPQWAIKRKADPVSNKIHGKKKAFRKCSEEGERGRDLRTDLPSGLSAQSWRETEHSWCEPAPDGSVQPDSFQG